MSASLPSWRVWALGSFCLVGGQRKGAYGDEAFPQAGDVYTIRGIEWVAKNEMWQVWLVEIVNPSRVYNTAYGAALCEASWGIDRFRPLVTIEDDIATHFAQHLTSRQPRTVEAVE